jgi:hypothetical protein
VAAEAIVAAAVACFLAAATMDDVAHFMVHCSTFLSLFFCLITFMWVCINEMSYVI